jgi:hypothetical protein
VRVFDEDVPAGQYTYPFQLYLPEWLPDSLKFTTPHGKVFVEYTVRAQFLTTNSFDFVVDPRFPGKHEDVSIYRGWREILVY